MSDDYGTYNDDTVHNMWVDYTAEQYEAGYDVSCSYAPLSEPHISTLTGNQIQQYIDLPATTLRESEYRVKCLREKIRRVTQSLDRRKERMMHVAEPRKLQHIQDSITETRARIHRLELQLQEEEQNGRNLRAKRIKLQTLILAVVCLVIAIWVCL